MYRTHFLYIAIRLIGSQYINQVMIAFIYNDEYVYLALTVIEI